MSTFQNKYDAIEGIIFKEGLRITSLEIGPEKDKLFIHLNNNQVFVTSAQNYVGLKNASVDDLKNYRLIGNGIGINWPDLDEDLSLKGFLKEFLVQELKSQSKLIIA